MPKAQRYKKTIVISFRIDSEFAELITYLKKNKISWQSLIYDDMKELLLSKSEEFKMNKNKQKYPF